MSTTCLTKLFHDSNSRKCKYCRKAETQKNCQNYVKKISRSLSHSFSDFWYVDIAVLLIKPLTDPAFYCLYDAGATAIVLLSLCLSLPRWGAGDQCKDKGGTDSFLFVSDSPAAPTHPQQFVQQQQLNTHSCFTFAEPVSLHPLREISIRQDATLPQRSGKTPPGLLL